jgi:hypothetical protein
VWLRHRLPDLAAFRAFCRPKVPVTHTYFHYEHPPAPSRSRRYIAYQMEYAKGKIYSSACMG